MEDDIKNSKWKMTSNNLTTKQPPNSTQYNTIPLNGCGTAPGNPFYNLI